MPVKVPIVNRQDVIIGYKRREELDPSMDIVRSASLWITNSKGEVLLAQRKSTKRTDPARWAEAVGGTVDGGDSYEETIYREADEELGIRGEKFRTGPKQFIEGPPNSYFVQWYYVTLDWPSEKFTPQESEVECVAWWKIEDLQQDIAMYPEKYIAALPEIVELLTQ